MLKIENLTKTFDSKVIFQNFSTEFENTGLYILTGDSGIGKTTLLRIISGLDRNFSGNVTGIDTESVSYAFQEHRLFPTLTALQNVTVTSENITDDAARDLLIRLGFSVEDTKLYPHELSGGMRQRVSLARAILYNSDILLLDEPTKELDATLADVVRAIISEESKHRLVIAVSHNEFDTIIEGAKILKIIPPPSKIIQ